MADQKEVKLKLTLDTSAAKDLDRVKKGMSDVDKARQEAQSGLKDFAKQTAASFVGMNLAPAIHQVEEFAKSFLDAAAAGDAADHALAGIMSTVQDTSWDVAIGGAKELDTVLKSVGGVKDFGGTIDGARQIGDELDVVALKAGVATSELAGGFQAVLENVGATTEGVGQAREQIEQIANVAGVLGKNTEAIAREFGFMEEGVLKTKGQLFQLLKQTGIFGSSIKDAKKLWADLTEEERTKRLEKGLAMISDRMGKAEPSFRQLTTSLGNAYDIAKEKLGEPLMYALVPELQELEKTFEEALPEIEAFAKEMGKDVGGYVKDASHAIRDGFKWLKNNSAEIKADIVSAFQTAKAIMGFIADHAKSIVATIAAAKAAGAISTGVQAVQTGLPALAGTGAGAAGALTAFGALGGTLVAVTAATYAWIEVLKQAQDIGHHLDNTKDNMQHLAELGDVKGINDLIEQAHSLNETMGMSKDEFEDFAMNLQRTAALVQGETEQLEEAANDAAAVDVTQLADVYNQASNSHNIAAQRYAATLLIQSGITASTLEDAGVVLKGGLESFAELFAGGKEDVLKQLQNFTAGTGKGAAMAGSAGIHMSGGQSFQIKQDFRDQDPDRVAVAFQRDIGRAAERRLQASTTTPFGG